MGKKSKGSVIVVEDDMLLSLVQGRIITKLGYEVVAKAVNGEDAIQKIKTYNPDVVIMDLLLKGDIDGIETMNRVRSFSDVSVIYLSGNIDKSSLARAKKTDYIDYLFKPISLEDIIEPLERAMKANSSKALSQAS